jgi:hypothetical protein
MRAREKKSDLFAVSRETKVPQKHKKLMVPIYHVFAESSSKLWHFCEKNLVVKEFEYECT